MRQTYHLSTSQEALQRNWSLYRGRRHREYSTKAPHGAKLVGWTGPVLIRCRRCHHRMGQCMVFQVDDLHGLVEDTARWGPGTTPFPPVLTGQLGNHPYWIHIEGSGYKAKVRFRCSGCRSSFDARNAHRLALKVVTSDLSELVLQ